jgi:hypothetical protein
MSKLAITGIIAMFAVVSLVIFFAVKSQEDCTRSGGHEAITSWYWSNATKTMQPVYNCEGEKQ